MPLLSLFTISWYSFQHALKSTTILLITTDLAFKCFRYIFLQSWTYTAFWVSSDILCLLLKLSMTSEALYVTGVVYPVYHSDSTGEFKHSSTAPNWMAGGWVIVTKFTIVPCLAWTEHQGVLYLRMSTPWRFPSIKLLNVENKREQNRLKYATYHAVKNLLACRHSTVLVSNCCYIYIC
jgi:hypothetical protein